MLKILVVILSIAGLWSFNATAQESELVVVDEVIGNAEAPVALVAEVNEDIEEKEAEANATVEEIQAKADEIAERIAGVSEAIEEFKEEQASEVVEKLGESLNIDEAANEKIDEAVAVVKAKNTAEEMSAYVSKLNLSPEQIEKVKELNEISSQKQKQLLDNVSWIRDQAHQLENLTVEAFRDILTDEQKVIFEQMRTTGIVSE